MRTASHNRLQPDHLRRRQASLQSDVDVRDLRMAPGQMIDRTVKTEGDARYGSVVHKDRTA